jgi:hypothetical protein
VIVTQGDRLPASRVVVRQPSETTTTLIREPTPISYIQAPYTRGPRVVEVRQPPSPVIVDVATPPVTTTRTTRIINDTSRDTVIDDRRSLVNYQDNYYTTRRTGRRTDWCGGCGADCCSCGCFDDCCGKTSCCRSSPFMRRKDVVSHRTRVTKDGRRVRYRVSSSSLCQWLGIDTMMYVHTSTIVSFDSLFVSRRQRML